MSDKPKNVFHIGDHNTVNNVHVGDVNIGRAPADLPDSLRNQILAELPRDKPITVFGLMGDAQSCILAEKIHAFLKANGFPLKEEGGISQGVFNPTPRGLSVNKRPEKLNS